MIEVHILVLVIYLIPKLWRRLVSGTLPPIEVSGLLFPLAVVTRGALGRSCCDSTL